jgi:hypothetical protein
MDKDKERVGRRKIQLEYNFDRLSEKKIVQVYQILLPDKIWTTGNRGEGSTQPAGSLRDEASSDLHTSLFRATKS